MVYEVLLSGEAVRDLDRLADYLTTTYLRFGDVLIDAYRRTSDRILKIKSNIRTLHRHPHRGTRVDHLRPGLRHLTQDRAIIYFDLDDSTRRVTVLAVFFTGQDHERHMLERLRIEGASDA